ncbi:MAG: large subunit ribosomal protein L23 [Candidatus Berkelbacteria bacterium Licking1014_85]|uniref:Large ribosomal subunit protein uL23 n=1 Tax=Candidatus Berkelbacteria bacterium Licking1014_85 TaxID=2017148 RepID=A0A554LM20_9BACT|nr:MAG: large subunit ribosomal protein L23 [Candidatus Berkelbacteria bacterium Licking1014_85]
MIKILPHISEKSSKLSGNNQYTFIVDTQYGKRETANEIEKQFKVNVEKISSISVLGKTKKTRGKIGKRKNFKKIIVTLKKGQKINDFQIETTEEKPEAKPRK